MKKTIPADVAPFSPNFKLMKDHSTSFINSPQLGGGVRDLYKYVSKLNIHPGTNVVIYYYRAKLTT